MTKLIIVLVLVDLVWFMFKDTADQQERLRRARSRDPLFWVGVTRRDDDERSPR